MTRPVLRYSKQSQGAPSLHRASCRLLAATQPQSCLNRGSRDRGIASEARIRMMQGSAQGPEFLAGELTGARLVGAIESSGAAVIRGCLDRSAVQAMLARAAAQYQDKQLAYERGTLSHVGRTLFEFGNIGQGDLDS